MEENEEYVNRGEMFFFREILDGKGTNNPASELSQVALLPERSEGDVVYLEFKFIKGAAKRRPRKFLGP